MTREHTYATLIVGAGFAGLGAAIRLAEAGLNKTGDIIILERADRVGGTWRDTTYPGARCDIPSLLYSYSFVQNPTWSRTYSPAHEICHHLDDMATKFDIRRHIRFGHEVSAMAFAEDEGVWTVTTKDHNLFHARTVVLAAGPLSEVSFPDIRGLDSYDGHKIHSARWDHDYDFTGKRVAVIGTGASAVQIVPELVKRAGFVKVFQRTPCWVLPRLDPFFGQATPPAVQALFAKVPATQQLTRQALFWGHEASRHGAGVEHSADLAGGAAGAGTPTHSGQRPVAAPPADPRLRPGLQTHADLQRLLPGAATRQLQTHRLADRDAEPRRHPHQRRHRTPPRLHRVRHRLRRPPDRAAISGDRARGSIAGRRMGDRRTGIQEHQRARLPELVLHDRPQLRARPQLAVGLHRRPARLRGARYHAPSCATTCAISMCAKKSNAATTSAFNAVLPRRPGCPVATVGISPRTGSTGRCTPGSPPSICGRCATSAMRDYHAVARRRPYPRHLVGLMRDTRHGTRPTIATGARHDRQRAVQPAARAAARPAAVARVP